jgi:hypothetical protein
MLGLKQIDEGMCTRGPDGQKSWKFPKFHMLSHAFDGIREKGVTANYNTKPNEHEHGETRLSYQSGNQKDVAAQVSRYK